jgi:uncharacterized protein
MVVSNFCFIHILRGYMSQSLAQTQQELLNACEAGNLELVQQLIERGVNPSAPNEAGITPAYKAAMHGHAEVVSFLASKNASLDTAIKNGRTPIFAAASAGHVDVIRLLGSLGADPNTPDEMGITPLYTAAAEGHAEAVKVLVSLGASVYTPSKHGLTPLCGACRRMKKKAAIALMQFMTHGELLVIHKSLLDSKSKAYGLYGDTGRTTFMNCYDEAVSPMLKSAVPPLVLLAALKVGFFSLPPADNALPGALRVSEALPQFIRSSLI